MVDGESLTREMPLKRLIRRSEAVELLCGFHGLLPECELSLITKQGKVYAGSQTWDQGDLSPLLVQLNQEVVERTADTLLRPVFLENQLVCALVARLPIDPPSLSMEEQILEGLGKCLKLFLEQSLDKRALAEETLNRYREINLIYQIGEMIGTRLETDEILNLLLDETRRTISAEVGAVILLADGVSSSEIGYLNVAHSFGDEKQVDILFEACGEIIPAISQTGQADIVDYRGHPKFEDTGAAMVLSAPVNMNERTLGAIILSRAAGAKEFSAGDGKLLLVMAHQLAISIEAARLHEKEVQRQRLEEELAIGREIQLSLLPRSCPEIPGWDIAAVYRSARQVGGDLYDFVRIRGEPHKLGLLIADVTGKGIPAALSMAFSRTVMRNESMNGRRPLEILRKMNKLILQDLDYHLFLSAFYASLDTRSGRLVYANGGHDQPLWYHAASGETNWLDAPGMLLGVFGEVRIEEAFIEVKPGDILVFYTDGITESRNIDGDFYGEERLREIIQVHPDLAAPKIINYVVNSVDEFSAGLPQSDDLTLFILKRGL